ncbi:MAG: GNAT family N-acetyltransferase [Bdellovibrionota bacterium]
MKVLETERLIFRRTNDSDAEFMKKLMNSPGFIENIGDRNIKTLEDAKVHIASKYTASYEANGYGLFTVELRNKTPIGTCGLVKRDPKEDPDIGFAYLPEFWGKGYAIEAALGVLDYSKNILKLKRVLGITIPSNIGSIKTLEKAGLKFIKMSISEVDGAEIRVYEILL